MSERFKLICSFENNFGFVLVLFCFLPNYHARMTLFVNVECWKGLTLKLATETHDYARSRKTKFKNPEKQKLKDSIENYKRLNALTVFLKNDDTEEIKKETKPEKEKIAKKYVYLSFILLKNIVFLSIICIKNGLSSELKIFSSFSCLMNIINCSCTNSYISWFKYFVIYLSTF